MIIIIVEDHHITTTIMNYEHDDHHLGCAARRGRCALRGVNEKLRNLEDDARDWIDVPRESRAGGGGPGGGQGCHGGYHVEYRYGNSLVALPRHRHAACNTSAYGIPRPR